MSLMGRGALMNDLRERLRAEADRGNDAFRLLREAADALVAEKARADEAVAAINRVYRRGINDHSETVRGWTREWGEEYRAFLALEEDR